MFLRIFAFNIFALFFEYVFIQTTFFFLIKTLSTIETVLG